jgi:hypothetical protein
MRMLKCLLTIALAAILTANASAESYVVSPRASVQTKAAVAEGKPPAHGFPEIHDVHFTSSSKLHPGTALEATVETSDNVGYVEGRVKYWNVAFTQIAPGKFALSYRVPMLPPSAIGAWDLQVIARSVDGVEIKRTYPVKYSYF